MPNLLHFVICESAARDIFTGRWSYQFLTDAILPLPGVVTLKTGVSEDGLFLPSLTFCSMFDKDESDQPDSEFEFQIRMIASDGQEREVFGMERFTISSTIQHVIHKSENFPVTCFGQYQCFVDVRQVGKLEWQQLGSTRFYIQQPTYVKSKASSY